MEGPRPQRPRITGPLGVWLWAADKVQDPGLSRSKGGDMGQRQVQVPRPLRRPEWRPAAERLEGDAGWPASTGCSLCVRKEVSF